MAELKNQLTLISLISLCLFSCQPETELPTSPIVNEQRTLYEEMDWEPTPEEEQEWLAQSKTVWNEPKFYTSSLRDLSIVQNEWQVAFLLCAEEESFLLTKFIETEDTVQNLIAISSFERDNNQPDGFYFYHYNVMGEIFFKERLFNADYYIQRPTNFRQNENEMVFFSNHERADLYTYEIAERTLTKSINEDSEMFVYRRELESEYPSPSKAKKIEIVGNGTALLWVDDRGKKDTLIVQEYSGDWSIGEVAWSLEEEKFYFDNSGAVACIWEIDLVQRSIDKIVGEHHAHSPILYEHHNIEYVIYCEGNCIKSTWRMQ